MNYGHLIRRILSSRSIAFNNKVLLRKIILTASIGRLLINGQSPDREMPLGAYLFDNEQISFDLTLLSKDKRTLFHRWLLAAHKAEATPSYFNDIGLSDSNYFASEVQLHWWERFKNWINGRPTQHWVFKNLSASTEYQFLGIKACEGEKGILIEFEQHLAPSDSQAKYKAPDDKTQRSPLGNTKRVVLTDRLVQIILSTDLSEASFNIMCQAPHPLSIEVSQYKDRYRAMLEYRKVHHYYRKDPTHIPFWTRLYLWFTTGDRPWYVRLWNQFLDWLSPTKAMNFVNKEPPKFRRIYEDKTVSIDLRCDSKAVLVREKKPDFKNLVFCGGGAKIYAHIGVWSVVNEFKIPITRFAGSSAGAIIALFCYLGFCAEEMAELFGYFKQHHLVNFDIDSNGFSSADSLKKALDFAINKMIMKLVSDFHISYPDGVITFKTLHDLKAQCLDCCIGDELKVTATNMSTGETEYFSYSQTPNMAVSEAVKISASLPLLYKPTMISGVKYTDGGVLSNFPVEAFNDDMTFIEPEYGINLETLAVQFDNGTERNTVDQSTQRVYRDGPIAEAFNRLLTGVRGTAKAWEEDRLKLRRFAMQAIIPHVGRASTTNFNIEKSEQDYLIERGRDAALHYFRSRYSQKDNAPYTNQERLYATFSSLEELLVYSCYRGNRKWFDRVCKRINDDLFHEDKERFLARVQSLRSLYFSESQDLYRIISRREMHGIFHLITDIFIKINANQLIDKTEDRSFFYEAYHSLTQKDPFNCLNDLVKIKGSVHIIIQIFIELLKELKQCNNILPKAQRIEHLKDSLGRLRDFVSKPMDDVFSRKYFSCWHLSMSEGIDVLSLMENRHPNTIRLLQQYSKVTPVYIESEIEMTTFAPR